MVDYSKVDVKVRESRFFIDKMADLAGPASRGALELIETVGFYLSAFLSASRSIDFRLRKENPTTYPAWRAAWDANLSATEAELIKTMVDDRNVEVHESGSTADPRDVEQPVGVGVYDLGPSGRVEVVGPPGVFPLATLIGAEHWIKVGARERRATEACREYLALLERMVEEYKTAHP